MYIVGHSTYRAEKINVLSHEFKHTIVSIKNLGTVYMYSILLQVRLFVTVDNGTLSPIFRMFVQLYFITFVRRVQ